MLQNLGLHLETTIEDAGMTLRTDRILVTGGAGFLGQHIVKMVQERADYVKEIRVLDLKPFTKQLGMFHSSFTSINTFIVIGRLN